ncbi:hypothetical protein KUTeg_003821 [Tegillarca granosa]|uniref:Uncharacterized protein n=1 Tax=Tegillarca granosa TaxID=220873 RepID=A0ABQ9FR29_TEGGR|nr:hypothetical protein KUTeg_003821 [Tegillarca granosa]
MKTLSKKYEEISSELESKLEPVITIFNSDTTHFIILFANADDLKVFVLGKKEAADKGPVTGFVRSFRPGKDQNEKYLQYGQPFAKDLTSLCSSEELLVSAVNNREESKITCLDTDSLEETRDVELGAEIIQLSTAKSKSVAAVLTKKGVVCIIDCSHGI